MDQIQENNSRGSHTRMMDSIYNSLKDDLPSFYIRSDFKRQLKAVTAAPLSTRLQEVEILYYMFEAFNRSQPKDRRITGFRVEGPDTTILSLSRQERELKNGLNNALYRRLIQHSYIPKDEDIDKLLINALYTIYNKWPDPRQRMEVIVNNLLKINFPEDANAWQHDPVRLKILKLLIKYGNCLTYTISVPVAKKEDTPVADKSDGPTSRTRTVKKKNLSVPADNDSPVFKDKTVSIVAGRGYLLNYTVRKTGKTRKSITISDILDNIDDDIFYEIDLIKIIDAIMDALELLADYKIPFSFEAVRGRLKDCFTDKTAYNMAMEYMSKAKEYISKAEKYIPETESASVIISPVYTSKNPAVDTVGKNKPRKTLNDDVFQASLEIWHFEDLADGTVDTCIDEIRERYKNYKDSYKDKCKPGRTIELLRMACELANGSFSAGTRKYMYLFALAGAMTYSSSAPGSALTNIETNLFSKYYIEFPDAEQGIKDELDGRNSNNNTLQNTIPSGQGINYKNFEDLVYLHYIMKPLPDPYADTAAEGIETPHEKIEFLHNRLRESDLMIKRLTERASAAAKSDSGYDASGRPADTLGYMDAARHLLTITDDREFEKELFKTYNCNTKGSDFNDIYIQNTAWNRLKKLHNNLDGLLMHNSMSFEEFSYFCPLLNITEERLRELDLTDDRFLFTMDRATTMLLKGARPVTSPDKMTRTALVSTYYYYYFAKFKFDAGHIEDLFYMDFNETYRNFKDELDKYLEEAKYREFSIYELFDMIICFSLYANLLNLRLQYPLV